MPSDSTSITTVSERTPSNLIASAATSDSITSSDPGGLAIWPTVAAFSSRPARPRLHHAADGHRADLRLDLRALRPDQPPHHPGPVQPARHRGDPERVRPDPHCPAVLPPRHPPAGQAGDFDPGYGAGSSAGAAAMGPAAGSPSPSGGRMSGRKNCWAMRVGTNALRITTVTSWLYWAWVMRWLVRP